jgi:hypothetical protein
MLRAEILSGPQPRVVCPAPMQNISVSTIFGISEMPLDGEVETGIFRFGPASSRGAFRDRHGRGRRDAVDMDGAADESALRGRRSRVVLTPRRWRQVCGVIRKRRWQESPVTGESAL